MSLPREWNWQRALAVYLTALLLAVGLSLLPLGALFPQQAVWPAVLWCALFTLGFQGLCALRFRFKWLIAFAATVALAAPALFGAGPFYGVAQGVKAVMLSFSGVPEAAAPYAGELRWAVCLLFSLLAGALAWDRSPGLALFTVTAVAGLSFALGGRAQLLLYALPAAAGLLMLLAGEEGKRLPALAVAAVLSAGALLLVPSSPATAAPLRDAANALRQFVEDYLFFNEYRASFSLVTEGYQPLKERLGGPAQPSDRPVMEVQTDRALLLRGRTYDDYSGLNWYDTLSSRRYLFASPQYTAQRDELFDLNRPLAGQPLPAQTVSVRMLAESTTTLFAPCRTLSLTPQSQRMVPYYNLAAERFITRNLEAGDAYAFTYLPYAPGLPETEQAVAACAGIADPGYERAAQRYLGVPRHIQQEVYDFAREATQGAETPYEKALGIQSWLRTHYAYNLDVKAPPEGVDFAAWFLIGDKQGYCTYFATAMTLLCRISGLPARYVTGYLASPDESGTALVTGRNAHAWTEVYLNGFGWLDFDATPRGDNRRGSDSGDRPADPPQAPSPSLEPEESPSPEPPSPPPEETGPDASPTPSPTPSPAPENAPDPPDDGGAPQANGPSSFPWWWLLLLLAAAALYLRFRATQPLRRAQRRPDRAADILAAGIADHLAALHLRRGTAETLHEFARRADGELQARGLPPVAPVIESYAAQIYGKEKADGAPFAAAYRTLRDRSSRPVRLRLALKRMFAKPAAL